jgi:hypothetical protein
MLIDAKFEGSHCSTLFPVSKLPPALLRIYREHHQRFPIPGHVYRRVPSMGPSTTLMTAPLGTVIARFWPSTVVMPKVGVWSRKDCPRM